MIQHLKCVQCDTDLLYDDGLDEQGRPCQRHPQATKYWKQEGRPPKMVECYCGAACGLAKYELDNDREIPEFLK